MKKGKLSNRLLIHILIFSSCITIVITAFQIFLEYKRDISQIEFQIHQIEQSFLKSLAKNLWYLSDSQIQLQLEGILGLPDIVHIELEFESGSRIFLGEYAEDKKYMNRSLSIDYHMGETGSEHLGTLHVKANIENVYRRFKQRVVVILASQLFKTFFVSMFILFIFHALVTRHLAKLSSYTQNMDLNHLDFPLALDRKQKKSSPDELDNVVQALNEMRGRINKDNIEKESLIDQLTESKDYLEIKVRERTGELELANTSLTQEITHRKQSEERIRNINSLFKKLLIASPLIEKLKLITEEVVRIFEADSCRIWIVEKGDLCDSGCAHAKAVEGPHVCRYKDRSLHLLAGSGPYTHANSEMHGRVPFACYKIGALAAGKESKFLTNDVQNDPQIHDHEWAKKNSLVAFAGYRLLSPAGDPVGVLALCSKKPIGPEEDNQLQGLANSTAQIIQTSTAEEQREKLISELKEAVEKVRTLSGLLPICTSCKKIRDDNGYWNQIESYVQKHSKAEFSHGLCPECSDRMYGDEDWYIEMKKEESQAPGLDHNSREPD